MNFSLFTFIGNSASSWISIGLSALTLTATIVISVFVYKYTHKRWLKEGFYKYKVELINKYLDNLQYIENKRKMLLGSIEDGKYFVLDGFLELIDKILIKIREIREDESKIIKELNNLKKFNKEKLDNNIYNINLFLIELKEALDIGTIELKRPEKEDYLNRNLKETYKCFNLQDKYILKKKHLLNDSVYIETLIKSIIDKFYNF